MKNISDKKVMVTTAGRTDRALDRKAEQIAAGLDLPFSFRNKRSVSFFLKEFENVMVVGKQTLELHGRSSKEPYFFHPNLAMVRVKRLASGLNDAFIEAAELKEGDSLLDCTLGFASDSITASYIVGESGRVTGIEGNRLLSYIAAAGLQSWEGQFPEMEAAMRRIEVVASNHFEYLLACADKSVDVVYFDPMFEESIEASSAMRTISDFAVFTEINEAIITEAKRVARKKVVLKDHFRSKKFAELGFTQQIRKSSKFHYGTISVE